MFDFFSNKPEKPTDVKEVRNELVQFIKDQLKTLESGEGGSVKGLQLFLAPEAEDRHLYEAAIYYDQPNRFRNEEVQKIADDYAIELPPGWTLDIVFDELPAQAIRSAQLPAALHFATRQHNIASKPTIALVRVMRGDTEQEEYRITPESGKFCIGRDKHAQIADGFLRINNIAFPSGDNESNRYVSRQHAHIEWNSSEACYFLFADEGGIPPRNKTKVLSSAGQQIRLQSLQIGHKLHDGDQVVLGESALLLFNYLRNENG